MRIIEVQIRSHKFKYDPFSHPAHGSYAVHIAQIETHAGSHTVHGLPICRRVKYDPIQVKYDPFRYLKSECINIFRALRTPAWIDIEVKDQGPSGGRHCGTFVAQE